METQLKETTKHILNDIDKHDADKIQNVLRARFLRDREEQIESFFTSYKDNAFIPFPDEMILSAAKVRAALSHYLEFADYEFIPTHEDLKDITGELITDEDFLNEAAVRDDYLSLDDLLDEQGNVYSRDDDIEGLELTSRDEMIDDGSYSRHEFEDSIYEALYLLTNEERELLSYRFGLDGYDELEVCDLAKYFQISESEVERCLNNALSKMKSLIATML